MPIEHSRGRLLSRAVLSLGLAWTMAVSPAFAQQGETPSREVRIRSEANVRAEGSLGGKILFRANPGEVFRLIAVQGDWLRVEAADGRRGYVAKSLAEVIGAASSRPAAAPAPPAAPPARAALSIDHKEVDCLVRDRYARLDACFVPPEQLGRAKILFRAADEGLWYAVDLRAEGPCHGAYLPKPLETTAEFQYYVGAVDTSFTEHQQPDTAPARVYRVRVVSKEEDCNELERMAASVKKMARPIVVALAKTPGGAATAPLAGAAAIAGFSQQGVILAGAVGAAGATGSAGAATAAGTSAAGSGGGGLGTGTMAAIGGGVVAVGVIAAVALGGGDNAPACTAADFVGQSGGALTAVDSQTVCSTFDNACAPGVNLRYCVSGVCSLATNCTGYYELSNGRRFTCASCGINVGDESGCLAAAQQVVNACN